MARNQPSPAITITTRARTWFSRMRTRNYPGPPRAPAIRCRTSPRATRQDR